MTKRLLIAVALAGCTEHGSMAPPNHSHDRTTCDGTTENPGGMCELACATFTQTDTGSGCRATVIFDSTAEGPANCTDTFAFEGVRGCCVLFMSGDDTIHFAECE